MSFKKALSLQLRAMKIWWQMDPQIFLSSAIHALCSAITPYVGIYFSAQIINELAGERNSQRIWNLVIITILITAVLQLLNAVLLHWKEWKHRMLETYEREIYAKKFMKMDYISLDNQHTRDLRSQIFQNHNITGWGLWKANLYFEQTIDALTKIIGAFILLISLFTNQVPENNKYLQILDHPVTILILLMIFVIVSWLVPFFSNKGSSYLVDSTESVKMTNRFFEFFVGNMTMEHHRTADIRLYQQDKLINHYNDILIDWTKNGQFSRNIRGPVSMYHILSNAISILFTGFIYCYVCLKAWAGAFGIGSITQYISAITSLSKGIASCLTVIGALKNNGNFLEITFEFLDIPNVMYQGSLTTEKRNDRKYDVEFQNVSFKYPGTDIYVLKNVSMKFEIGKRLAIVGMNGSGKTTFIKLLCRLYDPTEGEILLNGIDIRKYRYNDYLSLFSVVFQDFQLLSQPLGSNVATNIYYDKENVMDSLIKAGFYERYQSMPEGLDTPLYKDFVENGISVSGGEAQKIAIARALYTNAPFIIMDEPTATLDPIAEAEIYSSFNDIVGDKTAVFISHRLSSCRFCDEIIVLHEGKLVQKGVHETLVADKAGKYYELWNAQAQYYTN